MKTCSSLLFAVLGIGLLACDTRPPERGDGLAPVLPALDLGRGRSAVSSPLSSDNAGDEEDGSAAATCVEWVTEEESYDPASGEFVYRYSCPIGGDIAVSETRGVDDGAGNGEYTTTYSMRDGSVVVWTYSYLVEADGCTQHIQGSSSNGETFAASYVYQANGETMAHEVWTLAEGVYTIDGTYFSDDRFIGSEQFEDPATPASPDWSLEYAENADGSFSQVVSGMFDGWQTDYSYQVAADGSAGYDFRYDLLTSPAVPDYAGHFDYSADGSGVGSYRQLFDDGSTLDVVDSFTSDGHVTESWRFDDATTELELDQEGALSYQPDGSGHGTIVFHLADGSSETCQITVNGDGTIVIDDCG
ncbi:MAG: hypothetical protein JXR83_07510 [Deltaproteobacteria bacterium]|nr:hypothetical protein [Deltaproteobacteria bacterium]